MVEEKTFIVHREQRHEHLHKTVISSMCDTIKHRMRKIGGWIGKMRNPPKEITEMNSVAVWMCIHGHIRLQNNKPKLGGK